MALVVFSPSQLAQFRDCPRRWWGYRTKILRWKETDAKKRGTQVHECLEQALKEGIASVKHWPERLQQPYVQTVIEQLHQLQAMEGMVLHTEHEMCINEDFEMADWWDDDALLRAKADILCRSEEEEGEVFIGDWKTGRVYPGSDFQLRTEALLAHVLYKAPQVHWALFYVDQGKTVKGTVDFRRGIDAVVDILALMKLVTKLSGQGGPFEAQKNQFCKWCEWYHTEHCVDSNKW